MESSNEGKDPATSPSEATPPEATQCQGMPSVDAMAPDGDVILVVGKDKVHYRVYSSCLRSASPFFNTLFGPHWYEGQNLTSASPKHIELPDDNAEALGAIFAVLHHQNHLEMPSPLNVLHVAVLTDKYLLHSALRYAGVFWLRNYDQSITMAERVYLLAGAFKFEAEIEFTRIAQQLVLGYGGPFLGLIDGAVEDVLPLKVFRTHLPIE